MEVVLLGTGSADGWPNPFCTCASCRRAAASGEVRGQSAALVDGRLLIDCGPEVPRAAVRLGHRLDGVRTLLLTHTHPDHLGPAALLWRHWARLEEPLTVVGPPATVEACAPWLAPDDPVRLLPVSPGDHVTIDDYRVRVHAAAHDGPEIGPAVLYDITGPGGRRLCYATDTGPLPQRSVDALTGARLDLLVLEETFGDVLDHATDHLDLRTFPRQLARLREVGALTASTRVVATHLSHHNPPDLRRRLAAWGAEVLDDGATLTVGQQAPRARPAAPHRTLVLGGARSGKSAEAERILADRPQVTYIATARYTSSDAEFTARVEEHRRRRPEGWRTWETTDLPKVLATASADDVLLVDCLTLWLGSVLDDDPSAAEDRIAELVDAWRRTRARVVAVSNEVGSGVVPATALGRRFRDLQGRLNQAVAGESDDVRLLVAGRAVPLLPDTVGGTP